MRASARTEERSVVSCILALEAGIGIDVEVLYVVEERSNIDNK